MEPNEELKVHTDALRKMVMYGISYPIVLLHARLLMRLYDRSVLPDWVEILANGSLCHIDAVIDVARDDIREEGKHVTSEASVL
jgi:hypothetical protein